MEYKLFVFDVDGTIRVPAQHYVPESTKKALNELKQKGMLTALATGRNFSIVEPEIKALDFDYYICGNGATLYDAKGTLLHEVNIDYDSAIQLHSFIREKGDCICFRFLHTPAYTYGVEHMNNFRRRFFKTVPATVTQTDTPTDLKEILKKELPSNGIIKVSLENMKYLKENFPNITFTLVFDDYYDFGTSQASKGIALAKLSNMLKIKKEEIVSFGDGENDISMFKESGTSVAMGNAEDCLKEIATIQTDTIQDDGFYHAVKILLKENKL